jgi:hypothetical protein
MRRARSTYELGRLRHGLGLSALALAPVLGVLVVSSCSTTLPMVLGGAVMALAAFFGWRGGGLAQGVRPGLLAGSGSLALSLLFVSSHACGGCSSCSDCLVACLAGGILSGIVLSVYAVRRDEHRWTYFAAAGALSTATASLGCYLFGITGLLGMSAAMVAAAAPAFVVQARSAGAK